MSIKTEVRRVRHRALEHLLALRDEARLQLHLFKLDARKSWGELERNVEALEQAANSESEKALGGLRSASRDLSHAVRDLMTAEVGKTLGLSTTVRSLMTAEVQACSPEDTLEQAARGMWEHDCGALPVVEQGRVIAMLTDRDICMATFTQNKSPRELTVNHAMSKQLFTAAPDESVGAALSTMAQYRVRRLPVVSPDRRLLGMLSLADITLWARSLSSPGVHAALADVQGAIAQRSQPHFRAAA
jgi:CBS domain-containing protein